MVLTQIVRLVHFAVIFYVVFGPYLTRYVPRELLQPVTTLSASLSIYNVIYIIVVLGILFHWLLGSDVCALSILEGALSGKHYTQGFIHRLVAPIYNLPNAEKSISKLTYTVVAVNLIFVMSKVHRISSG